jgi:hypothetical protein
VELQWARLKNSLDVPLRRGAWYRIASISSLEVAITAYGKTVTVPRPFIDIRNTPPQEWTVLINPTVAPRTPEHFRPGYLVCPECRHRVVLPPKRLVKQLCPRCSGTFTIAWDEHYLEKSTRIV